MPLGRQRWGRYDPENNGVFREPESSPANEDRLDFAAIHTIQNSGQVYAVPLDELPGDGHLAAILHYAV